MHLTAATLFFSKVLNFSNKSKFDVIVTQEKKVMNDVMMMYSNNVNKIVFNQVESFASTFFTVRSI